jgi:chorismate mutase/prephenate dehydratase
MNMHRACCIGWTEKLKRLRSKIDRIDDLILEALSRRARITLQIARLKRRRGKAIYSPDREREVLSRLSSKNIGPLSNKAIESIYREIMSSTLCLERSLKVAYLGPQATFTHIAALKRFGSQVEYIACNNIADVFLAVEKDKCLLLAGH